MNKIDNKIFNGLEVEDFTVSPLPPVVIPKDTRGYLYLVKYIHDTSIIKVGRTINMSKRLQGYNASAPDTPFELVMITDLLSDAVKAEKEILKYLGSVTTSVAYTKEWFPVGMLENLEELLEQAETTYK